MRRTVASPATKMKKIVSSETPLDSRIIRVTGQCDQRAEFGENLSGVRLDETLSEVAF